MEQNIYGQWLKISFECRKYCLNSDETCVKEGSCGGASKSRYSKSSNLPNELLSNAVVNRKSTSTSLENQEGEGQSGQGASQKLRKLPHRRKNTGVGIQNLPTKIKSTSAASLLGDKNRSDPPKIGSDRKSQSVPSYSSGNEGKQYYEIQEYRVEKEDKRLLPIIKLPLIFIFGIVILLSLSLVPFNYSLYSIGILLFVAYLLAWNSVIEETLLVVSSLGIQVQQTNILGRLKYAKFVPIDNVKCIVINEIIKRHRVIAYLLILLETTESTGRVMVPVLVGTLPRLRTLESIYNQIQHSIF